MRCLHIAKAITHIDGVSAVQTPPGAFDGLDTFLARIAAQLDPTGGTVLLADDTHRELGLPANPPAKLDRQHPALGPARATGWKVSDVSPWMTFWRPDRPTVHVGVLPWLGPENFPLLDPKSDITTLLRMARFHTLVGVPYFGKNAGLPGITLLRDQHRGATPMWMPSNWSQIPPAGAATEVALLWRTSRPQLRLFEHQYDANGQFLAAALNANVAVDALHRERPAPAPARKNLPGYYLVTVPPWAMSDVLPHPMGNHAVGSRVWITGATLDLVMQVAEDYGTIAAPEVHDAWTAPGGRVLRPWAETIRDAVQAVQLGHPDPQLLKAVKGVYKAGISLLKRPNGRVCRPDWSHTVIGLARSNLWRKLWAEWQTSGRWPMEIKADAVWYASDHDDPRADWPKSLPDHDRLGGFTFEGTRAVPA